MNLYVIEERYKKERKIDPAEINIDCEHRFRRLAD